jgi:zinc and cadmium transporter
VQGTVVVAVKVLLAFALALAGGATSSLVAVSHKSLCRLISLAAGTLLGVTLFIIVPEAFEASQEASLPLWHLAVAILSGYALFSLVSRYVFHVCPACAASHFDEAATHHFSEIATAMIVALGLHSTLDGLALAWGSDAETAGDVGASLLAAICIHKIPEGLALGALLLGAGFSRLRVVAWVAAVEATTLVGGALGLWLLPQAAGAWMDLVLAHVGGGFIFLASHAVFGELVRHGKRLVVGSFCAGVLLIAIIHFALH